MKTLRASLSFVPKRLTTKSLAPGGWRSMARVPIAMTSEGAPGIRPAMSSLTAIETPAETAPAIAGAT